MKATSWEFRNRALLFGLIFNFGFSLYFIDHQISIAALANWFGERAKIDVDMTVRILFALSALLLVLSAVVRTWASAYLQSAVVYGVWRGNQDAGPCG